MGHFLTRRYANFRCFRTGRVRLFSACYSFNALVLVGIDNVAEIDYDRNL